MKNKTKQREEEIKSIISHYGIHSGSATLLYDEIHPVLELPEKELLRDLVFLFESLLKSQKRDLKKKVEGMRRTVATTGGTGAENNIYNQALDDIINLLEK